MTNTPDKAVLTQIRAARGQLEAVLRMVEEDRYCVDISKQILAVQALLKKANLMVLDGHIRHCVREAFETGNGDEKVSEVMEIIEKYSR